MNDKEMHFSIPMCLIGPYATIAVVLTTSLVSSQVQKGGMHQTAKHACCSADCRKSTYFDGPCYHNSRPLLYKIQSSVSMHNDLEKKE